MRGTLLGAQRVPTQFSLCAGVCALSLLEVRVWSRVQCGAGVCVCDTLLGILAAAAWLVSAEVLRGSVPLDRDKGQAIYLLLSSVEWVPPLPPHIPHPLLSLSLPQHYSG